nr:MAG TPA: hypothetical protein [Caudoviricetes sp.]DAZ50699.1 MAG TPA: hypothetical protein [Caudoviricetes sp.]
MTFISININSFFLSKITHMCNLNNNLFNKLINLFIILSTPIFSIYS